MIDVVGLMASTRGLCQVVSPRIEVHLEYDGTLSFDRGPLTT